VFDPEQLWSPARRTAVLAASGASIVLIALLDWWTKPYVSLGLLYLFPVMLAAGYLSRPAIVASALLCGLLGEAFSSLDPAWRIDRIALQTLALLGCGLFVAELLRSRRLSLQARQRLRALVETSPAAIVTLGPANIIEVANRAAVELLLVDETNLIGRSIAPFLPALAQASRAAGHIRLGARMRCEGQRSNGDPFFAEVWYSFYLENGTTKVAAIVADVSENEPVLTDEDSVPAVNGRASLNPRQAAVVRLVLEGLTNRQISERLELSLSAVKNTLQQIFWKTGAGNRSQMVRVALERYRNLL